MPKYQLSIKENKNIVDVQILVKDGEWIKYTETYRWGYVVFDSEDVEDFDADSIDLENEDGFDVGSLSFDSHEFTDCVSNAIQFSKNINKNELAQYQAIFEKDGFTSLAELLTNEGWGDDYETIFLGPLELVEI